MKSVLTCKATNYALVPQDGWAGILPNYAACSQLAGAWWLRTLVGDGIHSFCHFGLSAHTARQINPPYHSKVQSDRLPSNLRCCPFTWTHNLNNSDCATNMQIYIYLFFVLTKSPILKRGLTPTAVTINIPMNSIIPDDISYHLCIM